MAAILLDVGPFTYRIMQVNLAFKPKPSLFFNADRIKFISSMNSIGKVYAVRRGKIPGIYTTWNDCSLQVSKFKGAEYKSFKCISDAEEYMKTYNDNIVNNGYDDNYSSKKRKLGYSIVNVKVKEEEEKDDSLDFMNQSNISRTKSEKPVDTIITVNKRTTTVIYTDGSCLSNGKSGESKAGYAVYFNEGDVRSEFGPIPKKHARTNNVAEAYAILRALEGFCISQPARDKVEIRTDSCYVLQRLKWLMKTKRTTEEINKIKNGDIWDLINISLKLVSCELEFKYIEAHSGNKGNGAADKMAKLGASQDEN